MQAVPGGAAALELQSPGTVGQDPPQLQLPVVRDGSTGPGWAGDSPTAVKHAQTLH